MTGSESNPDDGAIERIDYSGVRLEFDGPLAIITLNDPEKLNAMGEDMANALVVALTEIAKPRRRCRAVLLTGEGRAFCAGANLMGSRKALSEGGKKLANIGAVETLYHPLLRRIHALQIPLIVGVNGLAIGIGLGMTLAADYVVAAEGAWFQAPFKNLASASDSALAWLLPRIIGPIRTKRILMRAERIDAATALDWGILSEVVPTAELAGRARAVATEFANDATIALGEIKKLINDSPRCDIHSAFEAEAAAVARTSRTKDNVAAIKVFGTKAKPAFTGE
ncbi:enoyl-CoA hydratase-related protein [Novosphingobium taihuense]|uniref:2-(1,2-epoxy-1,2-dihydrophenyl)acetyl-CoA isomerase n=1 Tax=Novosphingobium taihuense TaxID=260085 RepID=A0A7W7AEA8_9SPHN|nr:enoyl-CoA hydratase-related protein [Novosphingobium taihuense]MBB4615413.1 2-(1,2-epoxy-1,2-dihydrophenyl)acetyl-CoA isomerase [Novosphingobium taihuense]TWH82139.1 2-(1,2-epoxy-1,2-dihydrophenyl)acetyl-CoA isomerase [Novosphingobium taihuense]